MEAKDQVFQQLKPVCVKLSESALKFTSKAGGDVKDVTANLSQLLKVLRAVSTQREALNSKLADYVFFPLSNVLRSLEKLPVHARELTFECILILLQYAWSRNIAPQLGMQLLILYSFVAEQESTRKSEELQVTIFKSCAIVFAALKDGLVGTQNVPHLGKIVSLILENGILDGASEEVQVAAISALDAFVRALGTSHRDALGTSFLPGIMSSFAKALTGATGKKTWASSITAGLHVLTYILPVLFGNSFIKQLPEENEKGLSKKWAKATAAQVKMALANIMKLQMHDRQNVRLALGNFSATLLQECSEALSESVSMLLEASLTLATKEQSLEAELRHMLTTTTTFAETLQSSLHYWIMSLPRLMDSADETKKQRRIHQITLSFRLLNEQGLDMSMINRDLANNLRDSAAGAIKNPNKADDKVTIFESGIPMSLDVVHSSSSPNLGASAFENVIALRRSQIDTVKDLAALAHQISVDDTSLATAQDIITSIYGYTGDIQIASFWLALNMVREALTSPEAQVDDFFTFGAGGADVKKDLLEQLYDFSISTLSDTSLATETDWRLQALALEAVALQATQKKNHFRSELIDALYPVLHYMGSSVPGLRDHAITTLNIVAHSCGYANSGSLIISNVDYLVNAVALRLNTFDISPQAPQVLLMMVRLAGPTLLPYLDDTVESIFMALESFHGYPKLVDLLFKVLKVIVEEGAKTNQLTITENDSGAGGHRKSKMQSMSTDALVRVIQDIRTRFADKHAMQDTTDKFPDEPWGDEKKTESDNEKDGAMTKQAEEDRPPAPRTYSLLLNISKLTQHYLTASSSELRTSLLDLLSASFPALAIHENSFLPLINTLWPVLLPRLDDSEPYVVSGCLQVIGLMCKHAGDFMSGRIEEAWPQIKKVWKLKTGRAGNPSLRAQRGAVSSKTTDITSIVKVGRTKEISQPSSVQQHYIDAPSRIIWDSLVNMLIDVVTYTATNDVIFDDVVEILTPLLTSRPNVREALEARNADAVWLALFRLEQESLRGSKSAGKSSNDAEPEVAPLIKPLADSKYNWAGLH